MRAEIQLARGVSRSVRRRPRRNREIETLDDLVARVRQYVQRRLSGLYDEEMEPFEGLKPRQYPVTPQEFKRIIELVAEAPTDPPPPLSLSFGGHERKALWIYRRYFRLALLGIPSAQKKCATLLTELISARLAVTGWADLVMSPSHQPEDYLRLWPVTCRGVRKLDLI